MGKSFPFPKDFTYIITPYKPNYKIKPVFKARPVSSPEEAAYPPTKPSDTKLQLKLKHKKMEVGTSNSTAEQTRAPLAEVVSDCVKRWFQDTLKEAKAGDAAMQVLVGQMYSSGYGIPKDAHKGRAWINRASKSRSSAWKVGEKRPGYNVSDSDSEDAEDDGK